MPSSSTKQHNFMMAVAHSPSFAKKVGVPQSVGKDFSTADKNRKFSKGGDMAESKAMMKKEVGFMKKAGAPKSMVKHEMAEAGMKKGGSVGTTKMSAVRTAAPSRDGVASKGKTKGKQIAMSPSVVKATGMKRGGKC